MSWEYGLGEVLLGVVDNKEALEDGAGHGYVIYLKWWPGHPNSGENDWKFIVELRDFVSLVIST